MTKCAKCNKKLTIVTAFDCKCNQKFCSEHRYTFEHNCIEYNKEFELDKIRKNNPLVINEKIIKL